MTLPIARELARFGIRVMTIAPGIFDTPMMASFRPTCRRRWARWCRFRRDWEGRRNSRRSSREIIRNPMLNGEVIRSMAPFAWRRGEYSGGHPLGRPRGRGSPEPPQSGRLARRCIAQGFACHREAISRAE